MQIDQEKLARALQQSWDDGMAIAMALPPIDFTEMEGEYLTDAILADIEAQGFVVVPREPTEMMVRSGGAAFDHPSLYMGGSSETGKRKAKSIWSAMIDAGKGEG